MRKLPALLAFVALVAITLIACTDRRRGSVVDGDSDGGRPDATTGVPDPALVDCTSLPLAGAEYAPCCPMLGNDACTVDLVCAFLDGRSVPLCVSKFEPGIRCTSESQCFEGLVCRNDPESVPRCQRPAGPVGTTDACRSDSECTTETGPVGTLLARCTFDVGGSCRSATPADASDVGTCAYAVSGTCEGCGDATCTDTGIMGIVACGPGTICVDEFLDGFVP